MAGVKISSNERVFTQPRAGANPGYAWQFPLRVSGWRKSPAAYSFGRWHHYGQLHYAQLIGEFVVGLEDMKKITIIGLSVVLVVALILLSWQHAKTSKDRKYGENLVGNWSWDIYSLHGIRNYAADGSFTEQVVFKGTDTNQTSGTWYIKSGSVIVTITNDSNKKARLPRTSSEKIVRLDAHEFVGTFGTIKAVLNRIIP